VRAGDVVVHEQPGRRRQPAASCSATRGRRARRSKARCR
jgi:hypothetical protein